MIHNFSNELTNLLKEMKIKPPTHEVRIAHMPIILNSNINTNTLFRLTGGAHYTVGDKHITQRDNRDDYQLLLTTGGEGRVLYEGKEYVLSPNTAMIIDCRKPHIYYVAKGNQWEYKHIHFKTNSPQYLVDSVPPFQSNCTDAITYYDELVRFSCSADAMSDISPYICSNLISNMLTSIILENHRYNFKSSKSDLQFLTVIQYIHTHYQESIKLSDLTKRFNFSESYFIRKFKKHYNCSPHQYIINYRLDKVYELISQGETVQSAAISCGFNSTSSFYYASKNASSNHTKSNRSID